MTERPGEETGRKLFTACSTCGHLGFSHDNWTECAECDCDQWVDPQDPRHEVGSPDPRADKGDQ